MALSAAAGAAACVQQPDYLNPGSGGSGGTGGAGAGTGGSMSSMDAGNAGEGKKLFDALEPTLMSNCSAGCHVENGIADAPFLQGPDVYQSITSWPGIITQDPTQSKLETVPVTGTAHPVKLDQPPLSTTLFPQIKKWLSVEAQGIVAGGVADAGKYIPPFVPIIGFNAVYLTPLGDAYTGMAITFDAALIDSMTLELTNITVQPTAAAGVHLVHPLWVVYPVGLLPDPDPVDSFSNVDQYFQPGQPATLGPGTLVLTNWSQDAKLSVTFQTIELVEPMADGGTDGGTTGGGGCKSESTFEQDALPAFKANCVVCHGGQNPQAMAAVDMSGATSDPAAMCAQVKNRINPSDPSSSQIFVTTDPGGNAAHPFKFGGSPMKFSDFENTVTPWIQAEQ
jgi:mono/diheme cytochrome c family protein